MRRTIDHELSRISKYELEPIGEIRGRRKRFLSLTPMPSSFQNDICSRPVSTPVSRRDFLCGLTASLGSLAMTDMFAKDLPAPVARGPLSPKDPMMPAKAKAVIMLFMEGGPGHMDTFDPKPELQRLHKRESTLAKEGDPFKFFVGSPFSSRKVGQSGIDMCDQ